MVYRCPSEMSYLYLHSDTLNLHPELITLQFYRNMLLVLALSHKEFSLTARHSFLEFDSQTLLFVLYRFLDLVLQIGNHFSSSVSITFETC